MPATIDEVIARLDEVILAARREESRSGYFPALYRKVTVEVRKGIAEGLFDDGPRMERLDVIFANRYLDAEAAWRAGQRTTQSWAVAFEAASAWWPIVLQHLLLGMNAHINLDLGIAAAQACPGEALPPLQRDFMRINDILAALVDGVMADLTEIWPLLGLVNRLTKRTDDALVNFSMGRARDCAWEVAVRLAGLGPERWQPEIDRLDAGTAALGRRVWKPGRWAGLVIKAVRLGERGSTSHIIDVLS